MRIDSNNNNTYAGCPVTSSQKEVLLNDLYVFNMNHPVLQDMIQILNYNMSCGPVVKNASLVDQGNLKDDRDINENSPPVDAIEGSIVTRGRITDDATSATRNETNVNMSFVEIHRYISPAIERFKQHAKTYEDCLALETFINDYCNKQEKKRSDAAPASGKNDGSIYGSTINNRKRVARPLFKFER